VEGPSGLFELNKAMSMDVINIVGVGFGSHDYCNHMNIKHCKENFSFARQYVLNMAKAFNIEAIDIVCLNLEDVSVFIEECIDGFNLGFDGKFLIHPKQLDEISDIKFFSNEDIALANKIKNIKSSVFLIISDGELQEGSTWESMMMAANLQLDNLICFLDHNGSQSFGSTKVTHPKFYPINKKVSAFNWDCIEVNGHNTNEINKKINIFIKKKQKKPLFVICNTVKGKGVKFMENKPVWHYRSPNPDEYKTAIKNLKL
jgi:hypothetical protein